MKPEQKKALIEILKKRKNILSWLVLTRKERKYNLYCVKNGVDENFLYGDKESDFLVLYREVNGMIGESTMSFPKDLTKDEMEKKIDDAEFVATLIKNPRFNPLEKYGNYPNATGYDKFFDEKDPKRYETKLDAMKNEFIDELKKHKNIRLANLEIFLKDIVSEVTTSLGGNISQRRTENMLYAILLSADKEFASTKTECRIDDLDPAGFARQMATTVLDASKSDKPKSFEGDIILSQDAILEFFCPSMHENPAVLHAFGRLKHMKISKYELGKPIADFKRDRLTITSNPLADYGLRTLKYDGDTVPAQKMVIIENGIFKNFVTTKMYADYLKIKPSGPLGNIEVASGSKSEKEIYAGVDDLSGKKSGKSYEIVSFAWFNPNPFSGEFSAEIRLGYVVENGKKTPFKGGMLTGNVFKMIENAYYSKETIKSGYYFGPKVALFKDMTVASEE